MTKFKNFFQFLALFAMLLASAGVMLTASRGESAIFDETAHIGAGYSYLRFLDYRLNPEHPPLVKAIAALPLLFLKIGFPSDSAAWANDVNGEWGVGRDLLYGMGNDADRIVFFARIGPILITLLLGIAVYLWSRELLGGWWAILPVFFLLFSPAILAHGHYVTTDVGAALGAFLALYSFTGFLLSPSRSGLFKAGAAFGLAQLLKFSAVLLIPLYIFIIVLFYAASVIRDWRQTAFLKRFRRFGIRAFRYARATIAVFVVGYFLVYAVYFVFTLGYPLERQAADTASILRNSPFVEIADFNVRLAENRFMRPIAHYLLGVLMVFQRSAGGNTTYFLDELSAQGWKYYFPVIFALKESLPALILAGSALILVLRRTLSRGLRRLAGRFAAYLDLRLPEFSMFSFIALYAAVSIGGNLNLGFRHLIPILPFVYVLAADQVKRWFYETGGGAGWFKGVLKFVLVFAVVGWQGWEAVSAFPYYLSYYNELAGGVYGGHKYAVDSNYDWGQDLKRLASFVKEKNIPKIAVDYFGGGDPKYYLGGRAEDWWSARGNPKDSGIGWLAVSAGTLESAFAKADPDLNRKPEDEYKWLKALRDPFKPDYRAGTSIFIYKL